MSTAGMDKAGKAAGIARKFKQRGWAPIPIPPRSKIPPGDEWQNWRFDDHELTRHFRGNANIGVLNGEPSGWLIDVDLDHPLARELADDFLPKTASEFGRRSSRRSHRLYVVTEPIETHQRRLPKVDGKAPMIVELRSTGSQTVFPGSVHPEGESIEWDSDGEPTKVAPGLLLAAVNALADEVTKRVCPKQETPSTNGRPVQLSPEVADRARKYLAKVPPAVSGQGGHDHSFYVACQLVKGFALDRDSALQLLREWNQTCQPPWSDRELEHKIDDALDQPGECGHLLNGKAPSSEHGGDRRQYSRQTRRGNVNVSTSTPIEVEPYKPFPAETLPPAVCDFVRAASTAIGCDPSFIALPLLACLSRAIGNKRVIRLKRTWTEPAVIWAAIVGKSGTHKTPAVQLATAFLNQAQANAIADFKEAAARFDQDRALYDRDCAVWKRSKSTEPPPWPPVEPVCERFITTDCTIEALAFLLHSQFDGVLVPRDELAGWLGGIAEYKSGKGSDLGHWLASWSAAPLTVDRKTGAVKMIHVPRAAVSIVGGIQPGVLRNAIGREHLQDGLCARLLLAMPDPKPVKWTDAIVDPPIEEAMSNVFTQLIGMGCGADGDGNPAPFAMPLSDAAKGAWVPYFNRHRIELSGLDDDLAAAWSKLEAYTARFALIFQLCSWAAGEDGASEQRIDEIAMQNAIALSDWFGGEARRVYGLFSETEADRQDRELVELIKRKGGEITARELMRSSRRFTTAAEAEGALDDLSRAGRGQWIPVQPGPQGGKPTRIFRLADSADVDETQ
jgi:hypothetical protein